MQVESVKPEPVTFMGVLNACAGVGSLEEGRCIHEHIIQRGYESDLFVGSRVVDTYAKSGSIMDAQSVFNKMSTCMLSLGMQCLQDMPFMGILRRLLSILNGCVKKG